MAAPQKAKKPDLAAIYDELESLLAKYSPPFVSRKKAIKNKRNFELISEKEVVIEGRKKTDLLFAAVIEQKSYVGFYYMPIYCVPNMKGLSPGLMKLLKGKACFYVKKLTPELKKEMDDALKAGMAAYRKLGWM